MSAYISSLLGLESETDRQIRELRAMNDSALADLGIARDQIEDFVRNHAGGVGAGAA